MAENPQRAVIITTTAALEVRISSYEVATYTDIINSWASFDSGSIDQINYGTEPGSGLFYVMNDVAVAGYSKFSSIPGVEGGVIEIYQDEIKIFVGKIDHLSNIGHSYCTVHFVTPEADISQMLDYTILQSDDFANADPSDLNKMFPLPYGTPKRVPFLKAATGAYDVLSEPLAEDATTIPIAQLANAENLGSYGVLFIGGETITFITVGANYVLGRGAGAGYHPRGTLVTVALANYVFGIGQGVAAVDRVFSSGVLMPEDSYTEDLDGDATYPGCMLTFNNNPLETAVRPGVVSSSIGGGDDPGDPDYCPPMSLGKDWIANTLSEYPTSDNVIAGSKAYDENESTYWDSAVDGGYDIYAGSRRAFFTIPAPSLEIQSHVTALRIRILCDTSFAGSPDASVVIQVAPTGWIRRTSSVIDPSGGLAWFEVSPMFGLDVDDNLLSADVSVFFDNVAGSDIRIYEIYVEMDTETSFFPSTMEPAPQIGYIYPIYQSDPLDADESAFDRNDATCYDTAVDAPDTIWTPEFIFPEFCNAGVSGEIESIKLVTVMESTVDTTVLVQSFTGVTGGAFSIDPTTKVETESVCSLASMYTQPRVTVIYSTGELKIYEIYFKVEYKVANSGAVLPSSGAITIGVAAAGQPDIMLAAPGDIVADLTCVVTNPADVIEAILTKCGKGSMPNSGSYTAAENSYDGESPVYVSSPVIMQPMIIPQLLSNIAMQAKSIHFFRLDESFLLYMDGSYSADAVIGPGDIWQNQAWVNYTNQQLIANDLTAGFNHFWNGTSDAGLITQRDVVDAEDATSQSTYGVLKKNFSLPYITDSAQAQDVLNWKLRDLKAKRLIVEFVGTLTNIIALRLGHIITYNTADSDMNAMLAEKVGSTVKFLITNITYQNNGAIRISSVELTEV